jgi:hypothetical protein
MSTVYQGFIDRKKELFGDRFDDSDLAPAFVDNFNRNPGRPRHRILVRFPSGEEIWGFVGVSTGWKPVFLLMRREGQIGSELVLTKDCTIIGHKVMK